MFHLSMLLKRNPSESLFSVTLFSMEMFVMSPLCFESKSEKKKSILSIQTKPIGKQSNLVLSTELTT